MVAGAILMSAPGCSSWQVQQVEPAAFVREQSPSKVRITRVDRKTIVVRQPVVVGDSISGLLAADTAGVTRQHGVVALDDVRAIAVRRTNGLKTGAGSPRRGPVRRPPGVCCD